MGINTDTGHIFYYGRPALIDPYNNRPIGNLEIGIVDAPYSPRPYQVFIGVSYRDEQQAENDSVVTYFVPKDAQGNTAERIKISRFISGYSTFGLDFQSLLSGDVDAHAKALMDYADSLIPQVQPQLPEPPAAGKQ